MTAADGRGVTPDLRGPAERAEPCPGLHAETNRCVFPYGHEVHWNGAGDVWLSDLAAAEARGVERGYRRAVERLRDGATAEIVQGAFAEEWHRDVCACDAWPDDCMTFPRAKGGTPLGHAPDTHPVADVLNRVALYLEAVDP